VKYVVVGRLSPEARIECGLYKDDGATMYRRGLTRSEAHEVVSIWRDIPLAILDGVDATQITGKMYAEVWIEDEAGNRVTSPEKRVD
jgi:hypothetical protein